MTGIDGPHTSALQRVRAGLVALLAVSLAFGLGGAIFVTVFEAILARHHPTNPTLTALAIVALVVAFAGLFFVLEHRRRTASVGLLSGLVALSLVLGDLTVEFGFRWWYPVILGGYLLVVIDTWTRWRSHWKIAPHKWAFHRSGRGRLPGDE